MGHFSAIFSCFAPSASSRVTDEAHDKAEKPKSKSKSSASVISDIFLPDPPYTTCMDIDTFSIVSIYGFEVSNSTVRMNKRTYASAYERCRLKLKKV
ncbi:hypothetical protein DKX38_024541 [Salix brachista]|uniref:Uncharacterized protein n=1 Tax=Salix brachista TaxID=2182728 RepID=A0A5N5JMH6_9ROSI|nr:hypothetical protein DKX38_024541 [Salix brachista]